MMQTTTTNTNIPRRAHPAVVRAALRSRKKTGLSLSPFNVSFDAMKFGFVPKQPFRFILSLILLVKCYTPI